MLTDFYVAFATVCISPCLACGSSWSRPAMPSGARARSTARDRTRRGDVNASRYGDDITAGFLSACVLAGGAAGIDPVLYIQWSTRR
jgi:hypothetical protein